MSTNTKKYTSANASMNTTDDETTSPPTPSTSMCTPSPPSPSPSLPEQPLNSNDDDDDAAAAAAAPDEKPDPPALSQVVQFVATASPEVLAVMAVAGISVCYVLLGSMGMLVIGVVVGVVGHSAVALQNSKSTELGVKMWMDQRMKEDEGERGRERMGMGMMKGVDVDFAMLPPETRLAMEELTDAVVRDYVKWWYAPILPTDTNFPASTRNMIAHTLLSMYQHLSRKRGADSFIMFLTSTSNTFIVFFRELAAANRSSLGTYMEESPGSAMAQMLDRSMQLRRFHLAADDLLQTFFTREVVACEPVRVFFTEVLAGVVLETAVAKFAEPDYINALLVWLLEEETQPEILQKIDIGDATAAARGDKAAENRMSKGMEEMEKARQEAEALNRMIAEAEEEERRRKSSSSQPSSVEEYEPPPNLPPPPSATEDAFISFDQLTLPPPPAALAAAVSQTLHHARVDINDLTPPIGSDAMLKSKPTSAVYLLQIEPAAGSGWLVTRKYTDFETLHEVLRRISAISGAAQFSRHWPDVPSWRFETLAGLRDALERYINEALKHRVLAECEGMKRFLEKDLKAGGNAGGSGKFGGWPNPAAFAKMGQGALDVLAKAPMGVAEGGKGLFGGVKKAFTREDGSPVLSRQSSDMGRRQSSGSEWGRVQSLGLGGGERMSLDRDDNTFRRGRGVSRPESVNEHTQIQLELPPTADSSAPSVVSLPPPPSDMPDDYFIPPPSPKLSAATDTSSTPPPPKPNEPLTTPETQFIVSILFQVLTELYTLSSAWTLRRSLLNVAKSVLLRPGNIALADIRSALQGVVLDKWSTDTAVAGVLRNIRSGAFPTEQELSEWQPETGGEGLRKKARELVLKKGLPEAVRGMMGAVASEEALGALFDALQERDVARGLVAAVVEGSVRGVCQ